MGHSTAARLRTIYRKVAVLRKKKNFDQVDLLLDGVMQDVHVALRLHVNKTREFVNKRYKHTKGTIQNPWRK